MCKRLLVLFVFLGAMMRTEAQQLNYQAIARNANGVALTFRDVGIRLSIRDGSQTGSIVYSETRNVRTNQFGLFTVVIGSPGASNVLGSMASINWISGNKYLQVEIDPEGGNNYFQAGTSQLQAVPYALFANAAYPVGPAGGDLLGSTYPNPIIAPLAVTTGKLANQAVTNPKIQDNTIANIKLVNSKVTLNGLILNLGDSQDFAVGTNGTDVNIISAGKTHTFNIPDASIANRGLITPNAQTIGGNKTFNNDITAARIIRAGGIAAQFLKADGSVDNNTYLMANQPIIVSATGDATGVSTSSGTAPVLPLTLATVNSAVGTFGNNITVPSITANNKGLITNITSNPIPTATATTSGLLTVGDWNTFNNKQNSIPLGTATQYFRGDLSLGNFTNDVRNQLSAGSNITYANGNIGLTNNSVTINSLPLALGGSQSFATGSTGNDFNISSAGTVHSFNIPSASATSRGLLTSADFSNFNTAYASRITSLTTTGSSGPATLSGNVLNIPNYTLAGLGGISSSTTLNGLPLSSNQTFSSGDIGNDFNIISSGTNHAFNFPTASASARGLLSSTDWSTFNNKQSAISGTGYGKWNGIAISFNNQIPLGTDVSGTLLAANFGQLTGDVTNAPGSYATTIANDAVTTAKIADGAVSNAKLTSNGSFTLGSTNISLGSTTTTVAGLTLNSPTINTPAIFYTNLSAITSGNNNQTDATELTNDLNIITTAPASTAVKLPSASAGRRITIVNRGANSINVFPGSSAQINSLGLNTAFSNIPSNSYAEFYATSTSQWYTANTATSSITSWNITGNSGLNESNNFLGTTDGTNLKFRVNNTFAGQINKSITVGNTSFGFDSNDSDGTGDFNSAFGHFALNAITVGHQNSGFGAGALAKTDAGNDNTAVGQGALSENLSGDNNTGVGQGALTSNQTGTSNVAIGQASLRSLVNTNNNTAVGRASVENITTGTNNTVVGYIAGRNFGTTFSALGTNITTSLTESVMIGSQTRPSSSGSQNEIVIGFDAYGAGNNTVQLGNTSVTKVNTFGSMNASKFIGKTSGLSVSHVSGIIGNTTVPEISGNAVAGFITFTTGGLPAGTGDFITVTFTSPYTGESPVVVIHPVINGGTKGIATSIYCLPSSTTTSTFVISTGTALSANTEYQIAYHVIGREL